MPLRWRLVGLYAVIVAGTLAVFSVALTYGMRRSLVESLDRELHTRARAIAAELEFTPDVWSVESTSTVLDDYRPGSGRYFVVADATGRVRLRSPLAQTLALDLPAADGGRERTAGDARFRELRLQSAPEEEHAGAPRTFLIACGSTLAPVDAALGSIVRQLWILAPVILVLSTLGGLWLVSRALQPIERIAATAERITADNLAQRIDVSGGDELARLAATLNRTFARLHAAFAREKQFTADASHELRTPLAVIAGNVELARRPRSATELQAMFTDVGMASARMQATVEGLLTLARADAGALALRRRTLCLATVVRDVAMAHRTLADRCDVQIVADSEAALPVIGDAELVYDMVANLVTNAVRYNRRGGRVRVSARTRADRLVELAVEDTGIGIDAADQARVFERFFRVDPARAHDAEAAPRHGHGGAGLGLAIVKCIAQAHGGDVSVTSAVGVGSRFVVTLPAGAPPPASSPRAEAG